MQIVMKAKIEGTCYLELPEAEARALAAMMAYQPDDFLEVFYKHIGQSELKPNEAGFRKLVDGVRTQLYPQLSKIDKARRVLEAPDAH